MSITYTDTRYLSLNEIEIRFVSLDKDIKEAVGKVWKGYNNVSGERKVIQTCEDAHCIVSPANSFGLMDGGIDGALSEILSKKDEPDYIGKTVRGVIKKEYFGEQPIGTCLLVPTDNAKFPILAHAPTMTSPMNVAKTFNAYYAFKAVLGEVIKFNRSKESYIMRIRSILTTTFATGCGGMKLEQALEQMKLAYDKIEECEDCSWHSCGKVRQELFYLRDRWNGVEDGYVSDDNDEDEGDEDEGDEDEGDEDEGDEDEGDGAGAGVSAESVPEE